MQPLEPPVDSGTVCMVCSPGAAALPGSRLGSPMQGMQPWGAHATLGATHGAGSSVQALG